MLKTKVLIIVCNIIRNDYGTFKFMLFKTRFLYLVVFLI